MSLALRSLVDAAAHNARIASRFRPHSTVTHWTHLDAIASGIRYACPDSPVVPLCDAIVATSYLFTFIARCAK